MKKFFSNVYNIYVTVLGILASLPIIAPLLLQIGFETPARYIYLIYSFFCHQFASRSIHIHDFQYAWCARDTAIWSAIFITAVLVKFNKLPKLKWYWVIPFIIPMALDGGLQTIFTFLNLAPSGIVEGTPLYVSNNLSRFMTGAIFGIGVGWWLSQQLKDQVNISLETQEPAIEISKNKESIRSSKFSHIIASVILTLGMFILYSLMVTVWGATSTKYKPLDSFDAVVKTPSTSFFARREHAICPTTSPVDLLAFDCFLNR
jgi:uncharacterized membrane protein